MKRRIVRVFRSKDHRVFGILVEPAMTARFFEQSSRTQVRLHLRILVRPRILLPWHIYIRQSLLLISEVGE